MKKSLLTASVLMLGAIAYGQTPRLSLYEEFTGETCPPCASTNPGLCTLLAQPANTANCVPIKWQVDIPSAPTATWSLYQTNKAEISWRAYSYGYGINSAPAGRMDGQNVTVFGASSDHPTNLTSGVIATAASYTSAFSISMARAWNTGCTAVNLTITVQATANFNAVGPLVFRTVMVEKAIHFATQPGTNGEKDFYDIAIKSFPTLQGGISLPSTWTNGQTQTFTLSCPIPSYTRNKNQVAFVGFIEDDGNKKVAQAARTSTAAIPSEAMAVLGASVDVTCSNAITPKVTIRNDGVSAITNLTINPYTDGNPAAVTVWNGNLAVGASTTIALTGVVTSTTVGSHLFSFDVTMTVPLYNLTTNLNSVAYMVASSYGTPVAEGFVTTTYPPAGWALINNNAGPSWSRFGTAGGYNHSSESTKYDFYANPVVGDVDELYLPPVNLSGTNTPMMSMDIAYAQRNVNSNDKLEVFVSDNCGATWTSVFMQSGQTLTTFGPVSAPAYVPDPFDTTHWKTVTFPLTGFNKATVLAKLVTTNDRGNNLYVDNVNMAQGGSVGISSKPKDNSALLVYPNPASGLVNIKLQSDLTGTAKVSIIGALGQLVYDKNVGIHQGSTTIRVDVKGFANGIYFVVVEDEAGTSVKKLTVNN